VELILVLGAIATFVLSVSVAAYLALRPSRVAIERLSDLPSPGVSSTAPGGVVEAPPVVQDKKALRSIRKKAIRAPLALGAASETQKRLLHAGYRSSTALATFNLFRLIALVSLPGIWWMATIRTAMLPVYRLLAVCLLLLAGYVLPRLALRRLARRRQHRLRLSLPDALDLLVVCVEAGMGLNQAIVKVSEELQRTHPEISEELMLLNLEIRAGRPRAEALRNLGERTGVDDIISLAAMLIQTDKFGTSVARSLRVHSDALRTERVQRAEEAAAKTTIKLIFPLLFCVFPALLVVILGPAFLNLMKIFNDTVIQTSK
jgi:tight adherence protein C